MCPPRVFIPTLNLVILLNCCHHITSVPLTIRRVLRTEPVLWQTNITRKSIVTMIDIRIRIKSNIITADQFSSGINILSDSVETGVYGRLDSSSLLNCWADSGWIGRVLLVIQSVRKLVDGI